MNAGICNRLLSASLFTKGTICVLCLFRDPLVDSLILAIGSIDILVAPLLGSPLPELRLVFTSQSELLLIALVLRNAELGVFQHLGLGHATSRSLAVSVRLSRTSGADGRHALPEGAVDVLQFGENLGQDIVVPTGSLASATRTRAATRSINRRLASSAAASSPQLVEFPLDRLEALASSSSTVGQGARGLGLL